MPAREASRDVSGGATTDCPRRLPTVRPFSASGCLSCEHFQAAPAIQFSCDAALHSGEPPLGPPGENPLARCSVLSAREGRPLLAVLRPCGGPHQRPPKRFGGDFYYIPEALSPG